MSSVANLVNAEATHVDAGIEVVVDPPIELVLARTRYERWFKRPLDILGVALLAPIVIPTVAAVAILIRISLGKSVFYRQTRIGRGGRPFTIVKFRTMRHDRRAESVNVSTDRRTAHKADHDPRHTVPGRVLRRLSLDELPQLWNVLRGEMSLVGPRPELRVVAEARGIVSHVRHTVRPGMTGPYQVSDLRLNGDLRDGLHLDEEYVQRVTLRSDLALLLHTVVLMLTFRASGC